MPPGHDRRPTAPRDLRAWLRQPSGPLAGGPLDADTEVVSSGDGSTLLLIENRNGAAAMTLRDAATGGCQCPVELGCVCGAIKRVQVVKQSARLASVTEIERNPRARSARLRVARKLAS